MEDCINSITENCTDLRLPLINLKYFKILESKILWMWKALLEQSTTSTLLHLVTCSCKKMVSLHLSTPFYVNKPWAKCGYPCQGTGNQQSQAVHSTFHNLFLTQPQLVTSSWHTRGWHTSLCCLTAKNIKAEVAWDFLELLVFVPREHCSVPTIIYLSCNCPLSPWARWRLHVPFLHVCLEDHD